MARPLTLTKGTEMNGDTVNREVERAGRLVGGTIQKVLKVDSSKLFPDGSYGLEVRMPDGKAFHVWVDCDPEGNGPGHLEIEKLTR